MSDKWLRAATIGSIWASIEIIVGSFLHNLRLPFAGSILSFLAVVLMVAFLNLWPQRGIIWRAGLICALMKSLSPSAVILGPMTGILLEAVLMEAAMIFPGPNIAGMIVGGMLAVLSALFHKAVNLLILYGNDLATLLDRLVLFAAKQLGLSTVTGIDVLLVLALFYLASGALAAILGWRLAKGVGNEPAAGTPWKGSLEQTNRLFGLSEAQSYSALLLAAHLIALVTLLVGINRLPVYYWLAPGIIYLTFCMFRYKRALRELVRPRFWIQFALITFLSTLLLQSVATGSWFSRTGLEAGLLMNVRAFVVLTSFTAISTELKNPLVKALLFRRGLANLYKSVSLAFSVLPGIIDLTRKESQMAGEGLSLSRSGGAALRKGFPALVGAYLLRANRLVEQFRDLQESLPRICLVVGDREEGKTAYVTALIDELTRQGKRVRGFVAMGEHDTKGLRTGFVIRNITTGEEAPFCSFDGPDNWEKAGRFRFNPHGIAKGYEWLDPRHIVDADILVIDELGPLELAGKGWSNLISDILQKNPKPMIWTVRRSLADKIAVKWNVGDVRKMDVADGLSTYRCIDDKINSTLP